MARKYAGFSFGRHQLVGRELYDMRERLQSLLIEIGKAYGKTSKARKLADIAIKRIDKLRHHLEDLVSKENPDRRKDREVSRCYHPHDR